MKPAIKLIIAAALLLAVVGGYLLVSSLTKDKDDGTDETGDTVVFSLPDQVTAVKITTADGSVPLEYINGQWQLTSDQSFPVLATSLDDIKTAVTEITAFREITDPEEIDLDLFGLADPAISVEITTTADESSKTVTFAFGAYNKTLDGYYMSAGGSSSVFLVKSEFEAYFDKTLYDFCAVDALPSIVSTDVDEILITEGEKVLDLKYDETYNPDVYTDLNKWYRTDAEAVSPVRDAAVTVLAGKLVGMTFASCVNYSADDAALAEYGLSQPSATLHLRYTTTTDDTTVRGTLDIAFGSKTDGGYYVMWDGTDMVFIISEADAEAILGYIDTDISVYELCSIDIANVKMFEVSLDGKNYVFGRTIKTVTDDSGTSTDTAVYTLNGILTDTTVVESFFSSLTSLKAESTASDEGGELYMSITITRDRETFAEMTMNIYTYNDNFYRVEFDGVTDSLVSLRTIQTMADQIKALAY